MIYDIAVIGGGAAGITAAIMSARLNKNVVILERLPRLAKKILSTGNGRCNITNKNISAEYYHGADKEFIQNVLDKFSLCNTLEFFSSLGIECTELENGKLFPMSLQASSVSDLLRTEIERLGVTVITDFNATDISENFEITAEDGRTITAKKIIASCGGKSAPSCGTDGSFYAVLQKLGHTVNLPTPSLVQLKSKDVPKSLKGIKHICSATVKTENHCSEQYGEVLFTEYGLSGPCIFNLSRIAAKALYSKKNVSVSLDLMPQFSKERLIEFLSNRYALLPHLKGPDFLNGILNKRLGQEIMKRASSPSEIAELIKNFRFSVWGTMPWENTQVTAGGISANEVNYDLQSKLVKGLYFAGEILDVDGDCGGFNLQWAWSSGSVAAFSACENGGLND